MINIFKKQIFIIPILLVLFQNCKSNNDQVINKKDSISIVTKSINIDITKKGFCYELKSPDGKSLAPAHPDSGLLIGKNGGELLSIINTNVVKKSNNYLELEVICSDNSTSIVTLFFLEYGVKIAVNPKKNGNYDIILRTGPMGPAYGMGDHAAYEEGSEDLELNNFVRDPFGPKKHGKTRMISNFAIFPKQDLAEVNIEPKEKLVRITDNENAQGSKNVRQMPAFYYFTGSPKQIYKAFLNARNEEGYTVNKPKYNWFGVGWEAFGALSWDTNHNTVTNNINEYLENGYPLKWMVLGSGFWPSSSGEFDKHGFPIEIDANVTENTTINTTDPKKLLSTTSFGMWDKNKYPDPKKFIEYFHNKGLIFTIGLRIGFIPGGPFTDEGVEKKYFKTDNTGKEILDNPGFPKLPVYLLDTQNPKAVKWYMSLCEKWLEYGVDGFKEDLFGHSGTLEDNLLNPVNQALMDKGVYIMGRNNYLTSAADIHRYDDFNYNQPQDRGPINGLALAFSGFPYVYPDIIGGTGLATNRWGDEEKEKLRIYLIRYAQYASLNPSMSFGYGPWNFGEEANQLSLKSAKLHDRLHPYIYSNAVKAFESGFPYTMVPLPLAFPKDNNVYGLATTTNHIYEWMIGDALLAAPLFGSDFATANSRDLYLPKGVWIDYDTGEKHLGPKTLKKFSIPLNKTPLFVGGTGIVIEKSNTGLRARIYSVTKKSKTEFYSKDGITKSLIEVNRTDKEIPEITNSTTGKRVPVSKKRHAYEFEFIEGHNYSIK